MDNSNRENPYGRNNPYGRADGAQTPGGIPEDVSSYVSPTEFNPQARLQRYRPTVVKKVLAWTGVVFGVLLLMAVVDSSWDTLVGNVMLSVGFAMMTVVPGAYWLLCNRRDSRTVTQWIRVNREYRMNWEMLAKDEQAMFARPEELPLIPLRRWKTVWMLIILGFIVVVVGTSFLPDQAGDSVAAAAVAGSATV